MNNEMELLQRLRAMEPWTHPRYTNDDMGNSYLFADFFRDTVRYVGERKCWYVYDGRVWQHDPLGLRAMEHCKQLAILMAMACVMVSDPLQRDVFIRRVKSLHARTTRERVLRDASGVFDTPMSAFDADPLLFNCQNCTLDLRTITPHAHTPEDMLTMMSGVRFDPAITCERWEQFVDEVMQPAAQPAPVQTTLVPDEDTPFDVPPVHVQKRTYLQMALGYALTGLTSHECLFLLYGATTRNGKGTLSETILRMMGDYGRTAMPDTIGVKHVSSGAPSEDVARLRGARFVNISEPDKKLTLSAALVKQMTGSDTITARFLHENSFEFRPQFKMFINTNYLPQVTDLTLFSSGRIKTIPFERHFEPHEQDRTLKELLAQPQNLSGILNWCLEGLEAMRVLGFDDPPAIASAIESYRRDSDKVAQFMDEMLISEPGAEIRTAEAYRLYQNWCTENGYMTENAKNFKHELEKVGRIQRKRARGADRTATACTMLLGYRVA